MIRAITALSFSIVFGVVSAAAQTTFPALLADKPDPAHRDQLMLFGQFIGDWDFNGIEYHDDGQRPTDKGEIQFRWVLQGTAVQDLWIETERSDSVPMINGTTLRSYDPKTDSWNVFWTDPGLDFTVMLKGRKVGNEIIMTSTTADGKPMRWILSDITANSFHWHAEKLAGKRWRTFDEVWARRKR